MDLSLKAMQHRNGDRWSGYVSDFSRLLTQNHIPNLLWAEWALVHYGVAFAFAGAAFVLEDSHIPRAIVALTAAGLGNCPTDSCQKLWEYRQNLPELGPAAHFHVDPAAALDGDIVFTIYPRSTTLTEFAPFSEGFKAEVQRRDVLVTDMTKHLPRGGVPAPGEVWGTEGDVYIPSPKMLLRAFAILAAKADGVTGKENRIFDFWFDLVLKMGQDLTDSGCLVPGDAGPELQPFFKAFPMGAPKIYEGWRHTRALLNKRISA